MHGRVRLPSLGRAHEPAVPVRARWTLARNTHLRRHQEGEPHPLVHTRTRQTVFQLSPFSMPKNNKHSIIFPIGLQIGEYLVPMPHTAACTGTFSAPFLLALCRVTGRSRLLHTHTRVLQAILPLATMHEKPCHC